MLENKRNIFIIIGFCHNLRPIWAFYLPNIRPLQNKLGLRYSYDLYLSP